MPELCYVERDNRRDYDGPMWGMAYFTTFELLEQWGDDWDDAPYEDNAGTPYDMHGEKITKLLFTLDHVSTPEGRHLSVRDINSGRAPWLNMWDSYAGMKKTIHAGASEEEFIRFVQGNNGRVFREVVE